MAFSKHEDSFATKTWPGAFATKSGARGVALPHHIKGGRRLETLPVLSR
jgi:hypothetical protein